MGLILFVKGMLCGFAIAAPVGPVGILCAQRSLRFGRLAGIFSGLGATTADTVFGALAAFGLHFIADLFLANQFWLRLVGGILLLTIGAWVLRHAPREQNQQASANGLAGCYASAFVLTITNPITILSFGAVFVAADAVVADGDLAAAWTLIIGVFLGSAAWFLSLASAAGKFRERFDARGLKLVNKVSAWIVMVLGVIVLLSLTPLSRQTFGY